MPNGNESLVIRLSPLHPGYVRTVCADDSVAAPMSASNVEENIVSVCVCETSGGEFCVLPSTTILGSLEALVPPELCSSASLLQVWLSLALRQLVPSLVAPNSAGDDFNRWRRCWRRRVAKSSLGGLLTRKTGQKDTSFLLYRHVMLGILGIAKVKSRNRKEDKSEKGAAAKGDIGISPLAHLPACILWAGQNPGHGGEGGHLGTE